MDCEVFHIEPDAHDAFPAELRNIVPLRDKTGG